MRDHCAKRFLDRIASIRATRRSVIAAAVAGTSGAFAARFARAPFASAQSPVELPQPKVLKSANQELVLTLKAMPATVEMLAQSPVSTFTYDGVVPGYTWDVNPGDTLKINLVNNLPVVEHGNSFDMTRPHDWTTTNLHTHGLHVSPSGTSDNVFLEIAPGGSQQLEIAIPKSHTGGLFWYHPHKHGGVTQQVRGGMAGTIIVRGEIDDVDEVKAAKEHVLVLQAIELSKEFKLMDPIQYPTTEEAFFPRQQILYTVNGVMNPKITMYPGEVQRWRILNAAEGKYMSLTLNDHALNVVAWDGLTLSAPQPVRDVMLSAGNRVELLVKAGNVGTYDFVLTPGSSQHPEIPGMREASPVASPVASAELKTRSILTIEVSGSGPEMALPTVLPAWNPTMLPIARTRQLNYTVQRESNGDFISFGIDGTPFDPQNEPYQIRLGTAEEWTIYDSIDNKLSDHAHGFHIHVNPFKITKINGKTLNVPMWRDTFALTGTTGDSFTFESNFEDFTGLFVEHCHVLAHEDLGMMEALEVVS